MSRLRIHSAGPGVSLQDGGRHGWLRFGVTQAGPMDRLAHALANLAIGNERNATAIEISLGGLELSCEGAALDMAVAGGGFQVIRNERTLAPASRFTLKPGDRLKIRAGEAGAWCYLAIACGFALPEVLGSQATHSRSGFGGLDGRCLRAGDGLPVFNARSFAGQEGVIEAPWLQRDGRIIRVLPGPQRDYFELAQFAAFLAGPWTVSSRSDRMGVFLEGERLHHCRGHDIVSDGVVMGSIQVPGDGQPIALMADAQSTGGYPKIATVISADLGALAQLRPGAELRFAAVSHQEALDLRRAAEAQLEAAVQIRPFHRTHFTPAFLAEHVGWEGAAPAGGVPAMAVGGHAQGRLTPQERLALFFDEAVFECRDQGALLSARGLVYGRPALAFAKNPAVRGGGLGAEELDTLLALTREARASGLPLTGFYDGASIAQPVTPSMEVSLQTLLAAGHSAGGLALALLCGEAVGTDALLATQADMSFAIEGQSGLALVGPQTARTLRGEEVEFAVLAAAETKVDVAFTHEVEAIGALRGLIALLDHETQGRAADPQDREAPGLMQLCEDDCYDMRELLLALADHGELFEIKSGVGESVLTAFLRLGGAPVGVVASQPAVAGGVLSAAAMNKAAQMVELCTRLALPVLRIVDSAAVLPGEAEAKAGALAAAGRLLGAQAALPHPPLTLVTRHAEGLAGLLMAGADPGRLHWPQAVPMVIAAPGAAPHASVITPRASRPALIRALRARHGA